MSSMDYINYFINYFEAWRIEMKLEEPFFLVGHSKGAYLSAHYAVQH